MAFTHGRSTKVYWDQYDLTAYCDKADPVSDRDLADTTCFGQSAHTFIGGLRMGSMSLGGKADFSAGASDAVLLAALSGTGQVVTVGIGGDSIGTRCRMMLAKANSYKPSVPVGDVISWSNEAKADGGIDSGVFLRALSAATATVDGASVDNGAASTNGYSAHIHVTVDDVTSATVKVQHSPDDSTWADLATFAVVSGVTSERLTGTGTVDRYTRHIISAFTGTSATLAVGLARR